jgi:Right handed beta helix region
MKEHAMRQLMSMKKLALLVAVVAATAVGSATAHAQNARTWVSGTGTNNSQCSVTQPCATFAQAIAATASGGEIDCLDPGGFGPVTISISVTIDCEGASNGGITVSSGTNAITINTTNIVVNLIGLDINGNGTNSGDHAGVIITAAAYVTIRNCKIYGFPMGFGIYVNSGTLVADNVFVAGNSYGILAYDTVGVANMTVRNSNISNNNNDGIAVVVSGGTHAGVTIEQTTLAFEYVGLLVTPSAIAVIGGSTIVNNTYGVDVSNGGTLYSFMNNQIGGNSTDIDGAITPYPGGPLN